MNMILERTNLVCSHVRKQLQYPVDFKSVLNKVRRQFKIQDFDLSIKTKRQQFLNDEEFYVNAYYDAEEDKDGETPIEVIIYHNFVANAIWDQKQTTDLLIQVYDAIVHEYRHQRQSKRRNHKLYNQILHEPYGVYLSDPDELDAYSVSIAIELCRNLGKYRALKYMSRFTALSRFKIQNNFVSPNLNAYISHFGNIQNPIIQKLAKKVYVRLKKIDTDHVFL